MTVKRLLNEVDSVELSEWQALDKLEHSERMKAAQEAKAARNVDQLKQRVKGHR